MMTLQENIFVNLWWQVVRVVDAVPGSSMASPELHHLWRTLLGWAE